MARLCERPGCSAPADVTYGFDAAALVVWLDQPRADVGATSGVLCRRHADAMVVPLGWMLDDRREPVPRLFRTEAEVTPRVVVRRQRHDRPPVVQLALEADDETGELIISPERLAAALALDDHDEPTPTPTPTPTPEIVAAPVLEVVDEPAPAPDPEPEPEPEQTVLPWQPRFDQSDDLSGLLKARGRLLSRAFGGRIAETG